MGDSMDTLKTFISNFAANFS